MQQLNSITFVMKPIASEFINFIHQYFSSEFSKFFDKVIASGNIYCFFYLSLLTDGCSSEMGFDNYFPGYSDL